MVACGVGRYVSGLTNEDRAILRIYHQGSSAPVLDAGTWWDNGDETVCRSVSAGELDGDSDLDVSAGGWALISHTYNGEINTAEWTGGSTIQSHGIDYWYTTSDTRVRSVYDANADSDSQIETVSGGQASDGVSLNGELRVWHLG
jgi:hypothetical protein